MADLHIEHDDSFNAVERRLHRVAVVLMMLVVVAGAFGLFGFGPLATATVDGAGYRVTYERFARNGAPLVLTVEATGPDVAQIWVDDEVLDSTQLSRVVPAAASERRSDAGTTFVFDGSAAGKATFNLTGNSVGLVRGQVGRSPDDAVPVSIFFYP